MARASLGLIKYNEMSRVGIEELMITENNETSKKERLPNIPNGPNPNEKFQMNDILKNSDWGKSKESRQATPTKLPSKSSSTHSLPHLAKNPRDRHLIISQNNIL